ncbi:MAG TPA: GntR family transcriptional regulator [Egicoccus sp.]|nr:GntR family transcriptional regulator [Egicoccus sp.]HSK24598.1 GntR family transcriptional regulator [Egicoccus sp.]
MSRTTPFARTALADQIADHVRNDILRGALQPGETINVVALAKRLGVSHIPVREAIRKLESEALVETRPYQSTIVAGVRLEELHEIYDLRRLIEGELAARSAEAYEEEDLEAIRAALVRLRTADPHDPDGDFWDAHREFHWAVLRPALDPWKRRVLGTLWQSAERYHRLFTLVFGSLDHAHLEHTALAEAATKRAPGELRRILVAHLNGTEEAVTRGYLASLESEPREPDP